MPNRRSTAGGSSSRSPKFKVVVAFEDNSASVNAMKTCEYVISQLGGDVEVRRKVVNFDRPRNPRILAAAARDAAAADMVIVSTRGESQLPSEMEKWMQDWSGHRSTDEGALVAIVNSGGIGAESGVRAHLADVARKANMDFFSSKVAAL